MNEMFALREHLIRRARVFAVPILFAAFSTCGSTAMPPQSEGGVRAAIEQSANLQVAEGDFAWGPSLGGVGDLILGRSLLFLGAPKISSSAPANRALYLGRARVTPTGRVLSLRGVTRVSGDVLADASHLVVGPDLAAVQSRAFGRVQSISLYRFSTATDSERVTAKNVLALAGSAKGRGWSTQRISFRSPPATVQYEIEDGGLVLLAGDRVRGFLDASGKLSLDPADPFGAYVVADSEKGTGSDSGAGAVLLPPVETKPWGPARYEFPPDRDFAAVPARAGVFEKELESGVTGYAFDMRYYELVPLPGNAAPGTQTGHVPSGHFDPQYPKPKIVFGLGDTAIGGAIDMGIEVAPLNASLFTFWRTPNSFGIGAKPSSSEVQEAVQWPPPSQKDATPGARQALCVTPSGHLVFLWDQDGKNPDALAKSADRLSCTSRTSVASGPGIGALWVDAQGSAPLDPSMDASSLESPFSTSAFYLAERPRGPGLPSTKKGEWTPIPGAQPEPFSMPAVYTAKDEVLGSEVELTLFAPGRFDWALIAGEEERAHRFGGQFPTHLDPGEAARAKFALSLGVAKRKAPMGLRIGGSTGLKFRSGVGVLALGKTGLTILADASGEPADDASELPITLEGGSVTRAARERGPKEARADLCVMANGAVVLAETEFDNHEATATALVSIGCDLAVGLDRGTERPFWSSSSSTEPLPTGRPESLLFALGRPLSGGLRPAD